MAEAHKARRDPRHHRRRLQRLAPHRQRRTGHAQRQRGRHTQVVHGERTQVFPNRRTQHRSAVATARIGRRSGTFELQLHRPGRGVDFAQPQCPTVAELPGPDAKLVSAVDAGQRLHAGPEGVATQHGQRIPVGALGPVRRQTEAGGAIGAGRNPVRRRQRQRGLRCEERFAQCGKTVRPREPGRRDCGQRRWARQVRWWVRC